ncbi:MAG: hypothetical protein ACTSRN_07225 [Alphaproteobacteria bacterium]
MADPARILLPFNDELIGIPAARFRRFPAYRLRARLQAVFRPLDAGKPYRCPRSFRRIPDGSAGANA